MFEAIFSKPLSEPEKTLVIGMLIKFHEVWRTELTEVEIAEQQGLILLAGYLNEAQGNVQQAMWLAADDLRDFTKFEMALISSVHLVSEAIGYLKKLYRPVPKPSW